MRRSFILHATFAIIMLFVTGGGLFAGDMYWSPVADLVSVNDFAVCGTTVYAATETGLFRSLGDPESWQELRSAYVSLVACSGSGVIWEESVGVSSIVYVSHDSLQTVAVANGLDDSISSGIRDLAIAGNTALVATLWGVDRSTDGGFNFPAAYPVLWESSAGYQITAVWTDGTACAAAGSGGFAGNGVWRSATGDAGTWNLALNAGGQAWLNGSGSTIVSGSLYGGASDPGYRSTNGGATWTQLPLSWGAVSGNYQKPFVSGTRILSRHVYDVFDPDSGQFIVYTNGPLLYETDQAIGNDLDPSLPSEAELLNQAIVETSDPFMMTAERQGAVYWFRVPGGWPVDGFDFTPPYSPSLNASPRIAAAPVAASATVLPSAGGATWMYVQEVYNYLFVSYDVNGFSTTLSTRDGSNTGDWVPYSTSIPWDLYTGNGLHSFYAWYADAAGNITDPGVMAGVTTFPQTLLLGSGAAWGTWMYAKVGESFTIGGSGLSGDIDVHHWEPGSVYSDDWAASTANDTLSFTARNTGYHLVILLNYPGAAGFDGTVIAQLGLRDGTGGRVTTKPAERTSGTVPDDALPPYYGSSVVTGIFFDGFESSDVSGWSSSIP